MSYARIAIVQSKPGKFQEVSQRAIDSLQPLFEKMPGFLSYRLIEGENDRGASLTEWQTKEQADASVKVATDWVKKNTSDLFVSHDTFAGAITSSTGVAAVEALYAAFNTKDFSRLDKVVAAGAKLVNMPDGNPIGVREDMENWATAFPEGKVEIVGTTESGNTICVEYIGRGTQTGPLRSPMGTIEPTKRPVELHLVDIVTMREGKIAGIRTYFDVNSLLTQLGIAPGAGVPPPAKAASRPEVRH